MTRVKIEPPTVNIINFKDLIESSLSMDERYFEKNNKEVIRNTANKTPRTA